ncbi:hypothetical protein IHE55_11965 [Streptomyces pactum]|uniref:Glyoxalase-like domain-containing protein n=1 Tax=Streptomyces pactum TaxID=68249 RepID=A0ABS0NJV1_9ACTN|nr:VOC family protein [Streptomyces pactum]MBH5335472.1 hypothetical protein [Streptomyces pactum]
MALEWKLVIDVADPHRQAAFWAEALGYVLEDHSPQIEALLDRGVIGPEAVTEFGGRHAWRDLAAARHPDDPFDAHSGGGLGRRLLFQRVPEPKTGKNRLHIDVRAAPGEREDELARLVGLGATVVRRVTSAGGEWIILTDPEGHEFCLQ